MIRYTIVTLVGLVLMLGTGCSSTKLIHQYKNPDTDIFEAGKVLVIGISAESETRLLYEKTMVEALEAQDVRAVKSIDFFETSFTQNEQSLQQLSDIESVLLGSGFDAILLSKVTGTERRQSLMNTYREFVTTYQSFEDYFYNNQYLYTKDRPEDYQVYISETSLFCICPGKERELIWQGEIEIVDARKVQGNIKSYINVLFKSLKEEQILL